jgi:hypothetical protein
MSPILPRSTQIIRGQLAKIFKHMSSLRLGSVDHVATLRQATATMPESRTLNQISSLRRECANAGAQESSPSAQRSPAYQDRDIERLRETS